jgi:hypothetical protein
VSVISEFWFAASAVVARDTLQDAELATFQERLGQALQTLPAPKLLILCPAASPAETIQQRFEWAAVREYVQGQDEYPWLELGGTTESRVVDQIVAAFESMQ